MDNGSLLLGDSGCARCYTHDPVEWFAEVFAFMSLIENDAAVRADYAARARTLLMHVIDKAALGQGPQGTPNPLSASSPRAIDRYSSASRSRSRWTGSTPP